ncbi:LacI family DNA-binding transcriptional regulator [Treponema socranskii]|uniref:LacI family DNA-binding transcriptional regulator n=1 Tax=Treponema socranskii TaxID=53419 RepID=UPI003D6E0E04
MATIKDVAERAGITVTTVSRVLNNRGYISAQTREKVYRVMSELDYRPNEIARALVQKQTKLIGAIVPSLLHPFFSACINYLEKYAFSNGFKLLVCNSQQNSEKESDYIDMLKSNKVSGIILCTRSGKIASRLDQFPVVTIERSISDSIPAVLCDNYRGGVYAAELLLEQGCKRPAIFSGIPRIKLPADRRAKAFEDTCRKSGVVPVVIATSEEQFNDFDYHKAINKMFDADSLFDGIFATSDIIAAQLLQACTARNISVPKDMKIIGFDDIDIACLTNPPLTTVHQPIEDMCRCAVEIIIKKMKGETVPPRTVFPVTLIRRASTF